MSDQIKKKIVKEIKVDLDKCVACRACEVACSGFHASPKYSSFNPARSRIRLIVDMLSDVYVPVRAGEYTPAECTGRHSFKISGKEYSECSFCPSSCPARDLFKEPDSGLPLKCDMCEGESMPLCVQVCRPGALTYAEREEERVEVEMPGAMDIGLQSLVNRHGLQNVMDSVARLSRKG
jgi:benzoyl-CoA reductase subunit BamC